MDFPAPEAPEKAQILGVFPWNSSFREVDVYIFGFVEIFIDLVLYGQGSNE